MRSNSTLAKKNMKGTSIINCSTQFILNSDDVDSQENYKRKLQCILNPKQAFASPATNRTDSLQNRRKETNNFYHTFVANHYKTQRSRIRANTSLMNQSLRSQQINEKIDSLLDRTKNQYNNNDRSFQDETRPTTQQTVQLLSYQLQNPKDNSLKNSIQYLSQINNLEKEKQELKQKLTEREIELYQKQQVLEEVSKKMEKSEQQLLTYSNIEKQVNELESYCQIILEENQQMRNTIQQQLGNGDIQSLTHDIYTKSLQIENQMKIVAINFQKINKIALHLFKKEQIPIELLVKNQNSWQSQFNSNQTDLLSPNTSQHIELIRRISEKIALVQHQAHTVIEKSNKTIAQITSNFITNYQEYTF